MSAPPKAGTGGAETRTAKARTAKAGTAKARTAKARTAKAGTAKARTAKGAPVADRSHEDRLAAARRRCERFLGGHGASEPAEMLADIAHDTEADRYGAGGVVEALESRVASLLGKPAALFLPSGTMAQQITLRVHADRVGRRSVVFHPACHLDWREGRGYQRLHHLVGAPAGEMGLPLTAATLSQVTERPAVLLIELPQRDLGGVLPSWEDLGAQVAWARDRGAAVHMDGARLWEAAAGYGRAPSEIAGLFDTVYVSFYKGLGAIAGCCLAGPEDVVAEVSEWRTRHGGRIFALWPYAASALAALDRRLPLMAAYHEHALAIARALRDVPGVDVLPDPPQAPMMHLRLAASAEELEARALDIAEREKIWTFVRPYVSESPNLLRVELSVGDATLGFTSDEVRRLISRLAAPDQPGPAQPAPAQPAPAEARSAAPAEPTASEPTTTSPSHRKAGPAL